ncbi:peptide chain release factor N(5)-glutamine methyltransferase [Sediminicola luteus]|uniref:Release factor glutamine methyltransferase n=1 Tax=Sediminicola luteus TaxID=319238 RepID=A0A2A4G5F4_9FLAO|nr:peptide chain release factor N(5)-glutamine methyltransferase [Sediminicola luteus]PCE63661.1 protein-(glutamine-N5) methyltransferase, release factor-specific [Sediminicola luteus]
MKATELRQFYHKELDPIYGKEEASHFFKLSMEKYCDIVPIDLALQPDIAITKTQEGKMFAALSRLLKHEPIQYILGSAHFMDMDFKVAPGVLIPRPETEELVRMIIEEHQDREKLKVLDIGTGSGCIAIGLSKNLNQAHVTAWDVSEEALQIANQNNDRLQSKVNFEERDVLTFKNKSEATFDIIVSNPPYVRELEKSEIKDNVKLHEPELALFVPDHDPLVFYRAIGQLAKQSLKANGSLYFEINQYLGAETKTLLKDELGFTTVILIPDMFGNDRFLKAYI